MDDCDNGVSLQAVVEGPLNSPYEGGIFRIDVRLQADYPFKRPYFKLLTPLYHPCSQNAFSAMPASLVHSENLYNWSPAYTIDQILSQFRQELEDYRLIECDYEAICSRDILHQLKTDFTSFENEARKFTKLFAH